MQVLSINYLTKGFCKLERKQATRNTGPATCLSDKGMTELTR